MNREEIINQWLLDISEGQWQLLNDQCNLVGDDGRHFATINLLQSRTLIMFPLHPSEQLESDSLQLKLLQLNSHPDVVGMAAFSLAEDNATIVLNFSVSDEALPATDLQDFWQSSLNLRNSLFEVLSR